MILSVDPNTDPNKVGWAVIVPSGVIKSEPLLMRYGIGYADFYEWINNLSVEVQKQFQPVVEDQYVALSWIKKIAKAHKTKHGGWQYINSVLHLAHHAGRWIEIADTYQMPEPIYVMPHVWMDSILGRGSKKIGKDACARLAVYERFPDLRKCELSEHEIDAICIGLWYWYDRSQV